MIIRVRLFAGMRQELDRDVVQFELPADATVADLRAEFSRRFDQLEASLCQARFAVDEVYVDEDTKLNERNRIACIPPVSGG